MINDPTESKEKRFERIAERRVTEIISKIRLLGNLSNKRNYSFTNQHVVELFEVIENELKNCKSKFKTTNGGVSMKFEFKKSRVVE